jgi:hypothetical protein
MILTTFLRSSFSYFCEHIIKAELMNITARPALAPEFWVPEDAYEGKVEVTTYLSTAIHRR